MTVKTAPNIQERLKTPEDRQKYLQAALASGDMEIIVAAMEEISKASGGNGDILSEFFEPAGEYTPKI